MAMIVSIVYCQGSSEVVVIYNSNSFERKTKTPQDERKQNKHSSNTTSSINTRADLFTSPLPSLSYTQGSTVIACGRDIYMYTLKISEANIACIAVAIKERQANHAR